MKKLLLLTLFALAGIILTRCDKIDPPYMVEEDVVPIDTTGFPFPNDTVHYRTVLLEEFTGHICPNCPEAAVEAHDLETAYGDSLVVIAVHAGDLADLEMSDFMLDLRCSAGTTLFNSFGTPANPSGLINRKRNSTDTLFAIQPFSNWESVIMSEMDSVPLVDMQMINEFNIDSPFTVKIHIQTEYLVNVNRPLKLVVYITEDDIVGNQKNNKPSVGTTPVIYDYHFMNVLRGSISNIWGDVLNTASVAQGTKKVMNYHLTIDNKWNHDNCHIVAFVADALNKKVLAVIKGKAEP